jgi:hypothetical protein
MFGKDRIGEPASNTPTLTTDAFAPYLGQPLRHTYPAPTGVVSTAYMLATE